MSDYDHSSELDMEPREIHIPRSSGHLGQFRGGREGGGREGLEGRRDRSECGGHEQATGSFCKTYYVKHADCQ